MSVDVSIEFGQNDLSNNFCRNPPYFEDSIDNHIRAKPPVDELPSIDQVSRSCGFVDYGNSSIQALLEDANLNNYHPTTKLSDRDDTSFVNICESNYGTWYSVDHCEAKQTRSKTQEYLDCDMMPPYYLSEKKYLELWVQCPRQSGNDTCEHSNQPFYYSEYYSPTMNSIGIINYWGYNERVFEDLYNAPQFSGEECATPQLSGFVGNGGHEQRLLFGDYLLNPGDPSISFDNVHLRGSGSQTVCGVFCVTSDTKYEEAEATIVQSNFNGRRDNDKITRSFSGESIKIEALNNNSSLNGTISPGSVKSEKIQRVRSKNRSRHEGRSKVPNDGALAVNLNDSANFEAICAVEKKGLESLMMYDDPQPSHCARSEKYWNRETYLEQGEDDRVCAEKSSFISESPMENTVVNRLEHKFRNRKIPANDVVCLERQQHGPPTHTTTDKLLKAASTAKRSTSPSSRAHEMKTRIKTVCREVTKYLREMRHEQMLLAEQLIFEILGEGAKDSLLNLAPVVTRSNIPIRKKKDQTTQYPEIQHADSDSSHGNISQGGTTCKRSRRRPRWRKKAKASAYQQADTASFIT